MKNINLELDKNELLLLTRALSSKVKCNNDLINQNVSSTMKLMLNKNSGEVRDLFYKTLALLDSQNYWDNDIQAMVNQFNTMMNKTF